MGFENVPIKDIPTPALIDKLGAGWLRFQSGLPQELVHRWQARFDTGGDVKEVGDNTLLFDTDLSRISLRGMHSVLCLMLGDGPEVVHAAREFWHKGSARRGIPFILGLSEEALRVARAAFPSQRCLVLSAAELKKLLKAEDPYAHLKQMLWKEIPKRRLNPYNQLVPAEGGIFFGRRTELQRIREQDEVCVAIAGPGRIGKTSLVRRYRHDLIRSRDPRVAQCFYVDFYDCHDTTDDGVARFLAMAVDPSSRSARMTPRDLVRFLRYHRGRCGRPLELILDEVDTVCLGDAFRSLGIGARLGLCRLVLCGRGVLLKTILSGGSPLECRLELMQLEPLDRKSAAELLLRPLSDLGFDLVGVETLADRILRLTGRLPHLIQFCGRQLVESAIKKELGRLSQDDIEELEGDFVVAQYFIKPLRDIDDPVSRLVGLWMLKNGHGELTVLDAQGIATQSGIALDHNRALEICNDLVINNVLAWDGGHFRIANEGLYLYAKRMGFLDAALRDAQEEARSSS